MEWLFLIVAGFCEIGWAIGLKYSKGFTNFLTSFFTIITMLLSIIFLSIALKKLPVGTAYAIWTGIGAVGTAILGMVLFGESREVTRLIFILFIVAGVIGLRFTSIH